MIFLYSTNFHFQQKVKFVTTLSFKLAFKDKYFINRSIQFLKIIFYCLIFSKKKILLPRAGSFEILLVYKLFKNRCVLYSDGISDLLDNISVNFFSLFSFSFNSKVVHDLNFLNLDYLPRNIFFSSNKRYAVFTKRGRDYDYVSDKMNKLNLEISTVNPDKGDFEKIFLPVSTLIFELINNFPKDSIYIISCENYSHLISPSRFFILKKYEDFFKKMGCNFIY
jgi:hypothetical protein